MIEKIHNAHVRKLCTLAQNDAQTLQYPLPDEIFGFHAQQSIEKLFKALISIHDRDYPFTHNLVNLSRLVTSCGEQLPPLSYPLEELQSFAVILRYDYGPPLSEKARDDIRESVYKLATHVISRILELEQTSTSPLGLYPEA